MRILSCFEADARSKAPQRWLFSVFSRYLSNQLGPRFSQSGTAARYSIVIPGERPRAMARSAGLAAIARAYTQKTAKSAAKSPSPDQTQLSQSRPEAPRIPRSLRSRAAQRAQVTFGFAGAIGLPLRRPARLIRQRPSPGFRRPAEYGPKQQRRRLSAALPTLAASLQPTG